MTDTSHTVLFCLFANSISSAFPLVYINKTIKMKGRRINQGLIKKKINNSKVKK